MPNFTKTYLSTVWIAAVELHIRKSIHVKVTVTYEAVSSQAGLALSRQRFIMEWQLTTRVNCLGELKTNSGHNKTGAKTLAIEIKSRKYNEPITRQRKHTTGAKRAKNSTKKSIRFLPLFIRIDVYKRAIFSNQAQRFNWMNQISSKYMQPVLSARNAFKQVTTFSSDWMRTLCDFFPKQPRTLVICEWSYN